MPFFLKLLCSAVKHSADRQANSSLNNAEVKIAVGLFHFATEINTFEGVKWNDESKESV